MAIYLKPKRGSATNASSQNIGLKKGELFLEFPEGRIGREPGRIVIGDGATSYKHISYHSTSTNEFQPFITDPSIYVPRFEDPTPTQDYNGTTAVINEMGDGTTDGEKLPNIIGSIKKSLYKLTDGLATLNTNKVNKNGDTCTNVTFIENGSSNSSTMEVIPDGLNIYSRYYNTNLTLNGYGVEFGPLGSGGGNKYTSITKSGIKIRESGDLNDDYINIDGSDIYTKDGWGYNGSESTGLNSYLYSLNQKMCHAESGSRNYQPTTTESVDLITYNSLHVDSYASSGKVIVFFNGSIKISENDYDNYASLTIKYKESGSSQWITGHECKNYDSTFRVINGICILNLEKGKYYNIKLCLEAHGSGIASIKTATSDKFTSWAILEI